MAEALSVIEGYRPGLIGQIVTLHAQLYGRWAGFGHAFECKVATELAAFVTRLDRSVNGIWHIARDDRVIGSIAIDGEDLGDRCAHLRWFIVDSGCQGSGNGKTLLHHALDFVDQSGFGETRLWTLKGLDAARSLYERTGFTITEEYEGGQWGKKVIEQTFTRKTGAAL